jgi:hypothetical protein
MEWLPLLSRHRSRLLGSHREHVEAPLAIQRAVKVLSGPGFRDAAPLGARG